MNNLTKIKQTLLVIGIIITSFILFITGIFTFMCLAWPNSRNDNQVEIGLVTLCAFLVILVIAQIVGLIRLFNNEKIIGIKSSTTYQENEKFNQDTIQNNRIWIPSIIVGGIIILFFIYIIAHNLDLI